MSTTTGEIGVRATVGGKRVTLDPISGVMDEITLPVAEVENTIAAGFRQLWVSGANDESEVELTSGGGVGSKYGTFEYVRKFDGAKVQLVFDATDLVTALAALAEKKLAERDHVVGTS